MNKKTFLNSNKSEQNIFKFYLKQEANCIKSTFKKSFKTNQNCRNLFEKKFNRLVASRRTFKTAQTDVMSIAGRPLIKDDLCHHIIYQRLPSDVTKAARSSYKRSQGWSENVFARLIEFRRFNIRLEGLFARIKVSAHSGVSSDVRANLELIS